MLPLPTILASQLSASLQMLHDCIARCPAAHWDSPIVKYPFWLVAYHALCFADFYLSPNEAAWEPSPIYHPRGIAELNDNRGKSVAAKIGADFVTTDHRELLARPEATCAIIASVSRTRPRLAAPARTCSRAPCLT